MTPESYFGVVTGVEHIKHPLSVPTSNGSLPATKFIKWKAILYGRLVNLFRVLFRRNRSRLSVPALRPISWQFNVISCKIQQSWDASSSCSYIKSFFIWPAEINQKQTPEKGPFVCPWCFLFISIFLRPKPKARVKGEEEGWIWEFPPAAADWRRRVSGIWRE